MIAFALYLGKVCVCSGFLFLYYALALRNKHFHQWNRFYLLIAVFISLAAPLLQFNIANRVNEKKADAIQILQVVESSNLYFEDIAKSSVKTSSPENWITAGYLLIVILLLSLFIHSLLKLQKLIRHSQYTQLHHMRLIETEVKGSPFSFFHFIFWNPKIDIQSATGQQILQHELVHVKEKHTLDKILLQLVLIFFWCNPFFWLIRKEIKLIHEFIADKKAVAEQGSAALAAMILQAAYPSSYHSIVNQFFQTSIKRRLTMLSKIQNPRLNYLSRVVALPVLAAITFAFTVRTKTIVEPIQSTEPFTVVIDAGHGKTNGNFSGAVFSPIHEDEIVLSIAKKISSLNENKNLKIILTRTSDDNVSLEQRVAIAKQQKAGLFLSLHLSADDAAGNANTDKSGIEIFVSNKKTSFQAMSEAFGSALQKELSSVYKTSPSLSKREVGIYVLDKNVCPSVLLECGFITNQRDREFITSSKNQEAIAKKILSAIETFAASQTSSMRTFQNTDKNPKNNVSITKIGKDSIRICYSDGTDTLFAKIARDAVGKKMDDVESNEQDESSGTSVFSKIETGPSANTDKWRKYLDQNLQAAVISAGTIPPGTYITELKFIVELDGTVSDIKVSKDPGYGLGPKMIELIKASPKWIPAIQNGRKIRAYKTQPITVFITND